MSSITHKFEVKANDREDGTFRAYGNVFGVIDAADDVTYTGTFSRTIEEHKANGTMPRLLDQHGHNKNPIGIITDMGEDEKGLWFEGKFADTQAGQDAYKLVKMGALDEFSIGFITLEHEYQLINGKKVRNILDVDLKEISLVTFACNPESKLIDIKSAIETGDVTPRMVRKLLQDNCGLSRRQADRAIDQIKSSNDEKETKESDVESNENKEVEQKTAEKPVAEVKSTSEKIEQKASWWMTECLSDPILSVSCLMDAFYYLPATSHAKMIEIAEEGRKMQLAALSGEVTEDKTNSETVESKGEDSVDTEDKTDDEDGEIEEEEQMDNEKSKKEEKSLTNDDVLAWFNKGKDDE